MKMIYRSMAPIALALLLLTAACSQREAGLTSAEATALASGQTGLPTTVTTLVTGVVGTGTALTLMPGTPADQTQAAPVTTGGPPVQLCQFCMEGVAHAIVSIAETSTFSVPAAADGTPAATCNSVETLNGRQVVLCYATTPATFRLNVCASDGSCSDFLVSLQSCPNAQPATRKPNPTALPLTSTVEPTQPAPTDTPGVPTDTPIPPTSTP
jgi:hypothetical protein